MKTGSLKHFCMALLTAFAIMLPTGCITQSDQIIVSKPKASDELNDDGMDLFASWLVGSWDNIAQVEGEIARGVRVQDRRKRYAKRYTEVKTPDISGRTFAIENYDDGNGFLGKMERVSLHRFMLAPDRSSIIHEIVFIKDKKFRRSLINDLSPLQTLTEADIRVREDCRLYWTRMGQRFEGATKKGACVTNSYTDRDITVEGSGVLEMNRLIQHDRNFEMSGEEIPRPGYQTADLFDRVETQAVYSGAYLRRPTLMVHDMDLALSLYRDILGLRVGRLSEDGPDSYVYTAFNIPSGTKVMHATLDTDKGARVLSLVEVKEMQVPDSTRGLRRSALLFNANGRLTDIRRQLIAQGYTVLPNHALGSSGTEFGFIDKDRHLIAVYQFPAQTK